MSYKEKKVMFKHITQDYIDKYLKEYTYTINNTYRQKTIYVLDDEGSVMFKSILGSCEVAIIPQGIYSQTLPQENIKCY